MDPDTTATQTNPIKKFRFFYKETEQKLSIANGTPQSEILSTVRMVFGIASEKKVLFMDEEGCITVLSSVLPSETKLTVVDEDFQFLGVGKETSTTAEFAWKWKKSSDATFVNDYAFNTNDCSRTRVFGDVRMEKEKFWWRIQMKEIWCCQEPGIVNAESEFPQNFWKSKPEDYSRAIGFPDKFEGFENGPGSTGCHNLQWKDHKYLFYLDFESSRFVIINENNKAVLNNVKVPFKTAIPYFNSNKHSNTITLLGSGKGKPEAKWMDIINAKPVPA